MGCHQVRSLTGMGGKIKRLKQLVDGSMNGRVVDGWKVALQQAPPQVVAGLLKEYLRSLPTPLLPYKKCVPLGVVLVEHGGPVDDEDEEAKERADVLRQQVAQRLAEDMPRSRIVLLAKLMEMLGEVAFLSSVNGMTTYKLALSVHRVLSWRHSASGRAGAGAAAGGGGRTSSGGIVLSKYNDNASIVALVSYLISDGGKMFVYDPELEAQQTEDQRQKQLAAHVSISTPQQPAAPFAWPRWLTSTALPFLLFFSTLRGIG